MIQLVFTLIAALFVLAAGGSLLGLALSRAPGAGGRWIGPEETERAARERAWKDAGLF